MGPNGTLEKLENRKAFNHCCYCFAENCLVKLDFSKTVVLSKTCNGMCQENSEADEERMLRRGLRLSLSGLFSVSKVVLILFCRL